MAFVLPFWRHLHPPREVVCIDKLGGPAGKHTLNPLEANVDRGFGGVSWESREGGLSNAALHTYLHMYLLQALHEPFQSGIPCRLPYHRLCCIHVSHCSVYIHVYGSHLCFIRRLMKSVRVMQPWGDSKGFVAVRGMKEGSQESERRSEDGVKDESQRHTPPEMARTTLTSH